MKVHQKKSKREMVYIKIPRIKVMDERCQIHPQLQGLKRVPRVKKMDRKVPISLGLLGKLNIILGQSFINWFRDYKGKSCCKRRVDTIRMN